MVEADYEGVAKSEEQTLLSRTKSTRLVPLPRVFEKAWSRRGTYGRSDRQARREEGRCQVQNTKQDEISRPDRAATPSDPASDGDRYGYSKDAHIIAPVMIAPAPFRAFV